MEDKKQTIVGGQPTGDLTDSGNYIHNSDGTFGSKNDSDEDIDWDNLEFGELSDEDIINMINNSEQKDKNVENMSNQELLQEIKIHTEFIANNGFNLDNFKNGFNGDLKLKCSNFRALEKIMKKYPLNFNNCELIFSNKFQSEETAAQKENRIKRYSMPVSSLWKEKNGIICKYKDEVRVATAIKFNAKAYASYDYTKNYAKRGVTSGFWVECSDENLVTQTIVHEYGHIIHDKMFENYCNKMDKRVFYYGKEGRKSYNEYEEMKKDFIESIRKETYEEYIKDISNDYISYNDFKKISSEYGRKYGVDEWFAETFASLECGKPNKAAMALGKVLKNKGYMKED